MKFIRKKIRDWILRDPDGPVKQEESVNQLYRDGINFAVTKAVGGFVISTMRYDPATDRRVGGVYIINDNDDFSSELGAIVVRETITHG